MPTGPLPESFTSFMEEPNLAVIATVRADGRPQCVPTWYEFRDSHVLVNMDAGRVRLRHLRSNPEVSISIIWHEHWFRHVSVLGRVVDLTDDVNLVHIDALAMRYVGHRYKNRESPRVVGRIAINSWFGWDATTFSTDGVATSVTSFDTR